MDDLESVADFSALVSRLPTPDLRELRERCAKLHPGSPEEEIALNVIDGEIARREILNSRP